MKGALTWIEPGVAVVGGSALGGSLMSGVPVLDIAQSMQGSLGVAAGYFAGKVISQGDSDSWYPWAGAAAIPILTGGVVDRALLGMIGGAWLAEYAVNAYFANSKKNEE